MQLSIISLRHVFHSIVKARQNIGQKFSLKQNSRILDLSPAYVRACKYARGPTVC